MTIDELEEKVQIVHAHQGRQAKILLELLGLENEKVDIVEPVTYDEEDSHDLDMINEDIFNKNKDEGKTRSLLGVFPFNNLTNSDHHGEHHHHHAQDQDQHNHKEEDPHDHHNHREEHVHEHEETNDVGDQVTALRNPLRNRTQDVFPFTVKNKDDVQDTSFFSNSQLSQQINSVGISDGKGKKCVDKVNIN